MKRLCYFIPVVYGYTTFAYNMPTSSVYCKSTTLVLLSYILQKGLKIEISKYEAFAL